MKAWLLPALLAANLILGGCADESATGDLVGYLVVPDCDEDGERHFECDPQVSLEDCEALNVDPDFFALEQIGDQAVIRIQHGGRDFSRADGLQIHLNDVRMMRGRLGQTLAVGPDREVRAALDLFSTCPDTTQNFELRGEVVFDRFGIEKGDRIAGEIRDLVVRDGRSGALLGRLRGTFAFTVHKGPPYQRFSHR